MTLTLIGLSAWSFLAAYGLRSLITDLKDRGFL